MLKALYIAAAVALGAISLPANAATIVLSGPSSSGTDGNSRTATDGTTSVRVTGWSVNGGTVRDGAVGRWSTGVGVENSNGDNSHTIDNNGWLDFILLQFDTNVMLDMVSFSTGFHSMFDTDATIGVANLSGPWNVTPGWDNQSNSVLSPFTFFHSGSVGLSGSNTRGVNPNGLVGNAWIIAASDLNPDGNLDGFKVGAVTFDAVGAVPEPSTWALLILGFGLIGGAMRRRKTVALPAFA